MPSLIQLKEILHKFDQTYQDVIEKYENQTKEVWTEGLYYLGGQVQLDLNDDISQDKIDAVDSINKKNQNQICNSWEMGSVNIHGSEFVKIKELVLFYNTNQNKYYEEIENNIENVLGVLKKDEALCNMLIDMMNNKCNTSYNDSDCYDERMMARPNDHKHPYYKSFPDDNHDFCNIPEYMIDFYNESTLSNDWTSLSNDEKVQKLDNDLKKYFEKN